MVREVVEGTLKGNSDAWYFVVTNPADAMTTLAHKVAGDRGWLSEPEQTLKLQDLGLF